MTQPELQWSRDRLIAESALRHRAIREPGALQWSRDRLIAESRVSLRIDETPNYASMEPRSFDRGKPRAVDPDVVSGVASMEPRSFDRGKSPWGALRDYCGSRDHLREVTAWAKIRALGDRRCHRKSLKALGLSLASGSRVFFITSPLAALAPQKNVIDSSRHERRVAR